jgi:hypothetical protein
MPVICFASDKIIISRTLVFYVPERERERERMRAIARARKRKRKGKRKREREQKCERFYF